MTAPSTPVLLFPSTLVDHRHPLHSPQSSSLDVKGSVSSAARSPMTSGVAVGGRAELDLLLLKSQRLKLAQDGARWSPLIGTSSIATVSPSLLLLKRLTVTGRIRRVHKRTVVIHKMFWNADDVRFFQPVELRTKSGARGQIKHNVGTKGIMKAVFDNHVIQSDIVYLHMYKRQYPVYDSKHLVFV